MGIFQTPRLLITTVEKVAIERELLTLGDFFGTQKWCDIGLQSPGHYSANLVPTEESIAKLFASVCERLELDTRRIRLVFSREEVETASGMCLVHNRPGSLNQEGEVDTDFGSDLVVGQNLMFDSILGEMVRKLVAEKLILSGFVDSLFPELWLTAEVATVFFGFGLFTVNETVSCCQGPSQGGSYFSMVKLGALNSFGTGYLLALVLWTRHQTQLREGGCLRPDAEHSYQKSLEYLEKTSDSLLVSNHLPRLDRSTSISTLEALLKTGTPSEQVWLLELIQQREELSRAVTLIKPTLFSLLKHRDVHVAQLALHLVSFCESLEVPEIQQLQKLARGKDPWSSAAAANILSMHLDFADCETEFSRLVDRFDHAAAANAAQMASRFGQQASNYTQTVCHWIRISLNRCDDQIGRWYALILLGICGDVRTTLQQVFGEDEELLRGSLHLLDEAIQGTGMDLTAKEIRPMEISGVFNLPAWGMI